MATCTSPQHVNTETSQLTGRHVNVYKHIHICYPGVFAPLTYTHSHLCYFISMHTCTQMYTYTIEKQTQDVLYTLVNFLPLPLVYNMHRCTTEVVLAWSIPLSLNDEEWPALQ